ncbi:MAG: methyltransferase domain-containing protein [Planctomycetaceae bacterium]|nr:methyltransferase domain-containing protein [Planctomycetales bacterium]MCB9924581.1 methyltransferase domain-containing protein [Planctomycetaceae bacterium]
MSSDINCQEVVPGIPAKFSDFIVTRRVNIVARYPGFIGRDLVCLDAGCGNGASMLQLHDHFKRCHGVDANQEYVDQFLSEVQSRTITNCSASTADLCSQLVQPESFDRAISFEVIEHLPDELAGVRTLYHSLKRTGIVAISVPNKWWIFETHGAWLPLLPWHRVPLLSWLPEPIHSRIAKARIYTKRRIVNLLSKGGFRILESRYVTAPMDRLTFRPLQSLCRNSVFRRDTTSVPVLATSIIVFATKD